jgi:hypothetical protein
LVSEAVTSALTGIEPDISFISTPIDESRPLRLHDELLGYFETKYNRWASMAWIPTSNRIHTSFFTRFMWGNIKNICEGNIRLFDVAPVHFLVDNWTLLRQTCVFACRHGYCGRLLKLVVLVLCIDILSLLMTTSTKCLMIFTCFLQCCRASGG